MTLFLRQVLPNLNGSKINGATKKEGNSIMLMVNDRNKTSDSFWFTLFHEIGHIMHGDYGISFEKECGDIENLADNYAAGALLPVDQYEEFVAKGDSSINAIKKFADKINRDPGIVLGRLRKKDILSYKDSKMNILIHRYDFENSI